MKPTRPTLAGETADSPRQRAALYGGSCGNYPSDAWHEYIGADMVFLSDDVVVVPVEWVLRRADVVPVWNGDGFAYENHEVLGGQDRSYSESGKVYRPPLLRAYPRLSGKSLLDV